MIPLPLLKSFWLGLAILYYSKYYGYQPQLAIYAYDFQYDVQYLQI